MRVQFLNVTGLAGRAEEVQRFAGEHNTDLAVTVETWLERQTHHPSDHL
jgi:hypothetical protein